MATRYRYLMSAFDVPSAFLAFVPPPDGVPVIFGDTSLKDRLFVREVDGDTSEILTTNLAGDADYYVRLKRSLADVNGKDLFIFGQNTVAGTGKSGGKVVIAGGRGDDTRGVEIAECQTGSETDVWQICQFFSQGGTIGQMTCHGGSTSAFRMRFDPGGGAGISQAQFIGGTGTLFFYDAGTDHVLRCSDGASMGANERLRLSRTGIGFNGATPIAKPTITGAKGGNAALTDLLAKLALLGILTDSTT